ncbi:MAG TPA: signal peptidase I [Bacilli bacterium]|nr:signal peptidase I [Bacilli bacterium]
MTQETAVGHTDPTPNELNNLKKSPLQKALSAVITVLLVFSTLFTGTYVYVTYKYAPLYVDGRSMLPTLNNFSNPNLKYELGYMETGDAVKQNLKRFDIAIYSLGGTSGIIKRVIGLPHETIKITKGDERDFVYILPANADEFVLLEEDYLATTNLNTTYLNSWTGDYELALNEGEYFMLGDNRSQSNDSRFIGAVTYSQLLGRLKFIYGAAATVTADDKIKGRKFYPIWQWRFY